MLPDRTQSAGGFADQRAGNTEQACRHYVEHWFAVDADQYARARPSVQ
ncbi:MAG: hypothetical protein LBL92_05395 [Propionibacteriaceae bacterium]|nr:hypothetical protein [Propionibacteriaceae bacterium]